MDRSNMKKAKILSIIVLCILVGFAALDAIENDGLGGSAAFLVAQICILIALFINRDELFFAGGIAGIVSGFMFTAQYFKSTYRSVYIDYIMGACHMICFVILLIAVLRKRNAPIFGIFSACVFMAYQLLYFKNRASGYENWLYYLDMVFKFIEPVALGFFLCCAVKEKKGENEQTFSSSEIIQHIKDNTGLLSDIQRELAQLHQDNNCLARNIPNDQVVINQIPIDEREKEEKLNKKEEELRKKEEELRRREEELYKKEEEQKRLEEQRRKEEEEQKRIKEQHRKEEEQRLLEEQRRKEEEQRLLEEQRKKEEEQKRLEELNRRQEERRKEEQKRLEEQRQREAEQKRIKEQRWKDNSGLKYSPKDANIDGKYVCRVCHIKTSFYYDSCPYCDSHHSLELIEDEKNMHLEQERKSEEERRKEENQKRLVGQKRFISCPHCGEENSSMNMFCSHCGERL